jgi:glycosyltransferase involved in cell wall biosynthesis
MYTYTVSVIIPVYNVEPYLRRCLDSVCNQTWSNLEIICVNDCSPDNCAAILEEYAAKDKRFKIVSHSKNRGPSAARNTGMDAASGEYIYFIDSDDWIDTDYIEIMLIMAKRKKCNVIVNSNIYREYDNGKIELFDYNNFSNNIGFDKIGYIDTAQYLGKLNHSAWIHIWKKSFLDEISARFPEGLIFEDFYFQRTTLIHLDKIYLINSPTYHYYIRKESILDVYRKNNIKPLDLVYIAEKIYDYYVENELLDKCRIWMFTQLRDLLTNNMHNKCFKLIKKLFLKMEKEMESRRYLYENDELKFFDAVLAATDYVDYDENYLRKYIKIETQERIASLRRNVLNSLKR